MIRKLLIANRGEIACRISRTCREMGIFTVAVYSDADANALHVEMADEAVHLGGSPAPESYLNIEKILAAAARTGADAIHPGYGFLAENAAFAQAVRDAGLIFVGPSAEAIARMGDKRAAKEFLQDIPYVPGYIGADQSDEAFLSAAEEIGYPIMVKAAAGGGGKGMRLVEDASLLPDALAAARREAQQAFGDPTLMLEKALIRPRHIEVQIIGDEYGNVIALGERECSIQRRHQKIIEECPAPGLPGELRAKIHAIAIHAAQQLGYSNAGTIEFLLDRDGDFYFMEMNTRLQVEHPVTEMVYAVDLVRWQLEIAQGTNLEDLLEQADGHAIEVRIYAEDPANQFLPVSGTILHWQEPDTVRVDSGVRSGDVVGVQYDPMLAKIIAHGSSRDEAIRKLNHALAKLQFLGMRNNVRFLRRVLMHEDHLAGNISTHFVNEHPELMQDEPMVSPTALIACALAQPGTENPWRNNINRPIRHVFQLTESEIEVLLTPESPGTYTAQIGEEDFSVILHSREGHTFTLSINGHRQAVTVVPGKDESWWVQTLEDTHHLHWLTPLPIPQLAEQTKGSLRSPLPGRVIQVLVSEGQQVQAGDVLVIIEAMKMEHRIEAPTDGIINAVYFSMGDMVQADEVLVGLA